MSVFKLQRKMNKIQNFVTLHGPQNAINSPNLLDIMRIASMRGPVPSLPETISCCYFTTTFSPDSTETVRFVAMLTQYDYFKV